MRYQRWLATWATNDRSAGLSLRDWHGLPAREARKMRRATLMPPVISCARARPVLQCVTSDDCPGIAQRLPAVSFRVKLCSAFQRSADS
jgi:hypothetical protein